MSTLKTDAIVAVSTNGDLSLDGLGTGGVSIASTLKMTKGGDISSASPLVIDTDGNYFDVTGTTNFSAMTVESGNFFMLQFDGALTITHGSGIELPGAANLTTATGDRLMCYATAADTVEVMSVETEAAASSGFTQTSNTTTTSGTTSTIGSIPAGTKIIHVNFFGVSLNSANNLEVNLGDVGGIETTGYVCVTVRNYTGSKFTDTGGFVIDSNNAAELLWGTMRLTLVDPATFAWAAEYNLGTSGAELNNMAGNGEKSLSAELTQIQISGGTFDAGAWNLTYI